MKRPKIALPEIGQDVSNYTAALIAAGMDPVVISVSEEQIIRSRQQEYQDYTNFHADAYDGLLLPGGGDICPGLYGQRDSGKCMYMSEALDKLQFSILDDFVKAKKPVLGICRGHQLINVYFGGTLIQHLATASLHTHKAGEPDNVNISKAEKGSWLEHLYSAEFPHNSSHHQAVDQAGLGLIIDSRCAKDGVVEGMHHKDLPIYSVQWHPERMCLKHERSDTVNGLPVLRFFCGICEAYPERPADPYHYII